MPLASRWPDALLAGFASSMRTTAAPAALAARGRLSGKARAATLLASAGEFVLDKTPAAEDRIKPPFVAGRMAAGAYGGHVLAGPVGIAAGAVGAFAGTFATWRARGLVVDATGWPDPLVAVVEDVVAATAAAVATRPDPPEGDQPPPHRSLLHGAAVGLAAGLAGTAAMTVAQGAEFALTSAEPSSAPADVAEKLKRRLGRGRIKRGRKPAVNQAMHWLYGTTWGIPLGILAGGTNVRPEILGPAFGVFVWGAALAHQPALGIGELPWKRSPTSLAGEALFHVVYGAGAGAALRTLR
jgi:hypothetical protein